MAHCLLPTNTRVPASISSLSHQKIPSGFSRNVIAKASNQKSEIYLGFEKTDTAPRTGRIGKIIQDDPRKYPGKESLGFFIGATGGWAGGEATIAKIKEEMESKKNPAPVAQQAKKTSEAVPKPTPGKELLYIGFRKDELELRKSGAKGRIIADTLEKYPDKEAVGPLLGMTGGFAGGEAGLYQFVEKGDIKFRQPGEAGKKQSSPLTFAGLLVFFGAGGGIALSILLNAAAVENPLFEGLDRKTSSLIISGALGAVSLLVGGAFLSSTKSSRPQTTNK